MQKGLFIVFEGIDGCGKTTTSKLLEKWFIENNLPVYWTKEPTFTFEDKDFDQLKEKLDDKLNDYLISLMSLDRFIHVHNKDNGIEKMLNDGYNVICDRYIYSTYAYNCFTEEQKQKARELNEGFIKPNIVFYINTPIINCINNIIFRDCGDISKTKYKKLFNYLYMKLNLYKNNYKNLEEYKSFYILDKNKSSYDELYEEMIEDVKNELYRRDYYEMEKLNERL